VDTRQLFSTIDKSKSGRFMRVWLIQLKLLVELGVVIRVGLVELSTNNFQWSQLQCEVDKTKTQLGKKWLSLFNKTLFDQFQYVAKRKGIMPRMIIDCQHYLIIV
jgi:hypothetical protein